MAKTQVRWSKGQNRLCSMLTKHEGRYQPCYDTLCTAVGSTGHYGGRPPGVVACTLPELDLTTLDVNLTGYVMYHHTSKTHAPRPTTTSPPPSTLLSSLETD